MSWRLEAITDWADRACQAGWSVKKLTEHCNVSVRTLEKYFLSAFGESPHCWMKKERQRRAIELLRYGSTVKEAGHILGYRSQQAFARAFKAHYGKPPSLHGELVDRRLVETELRV